ncbi:hypothetical protein BDV27DRAFT_67597 [Aspergillus caelatus]|uniref:Uncharacterized protein n=2 Tax=Aspergillus subgen. Circumdati TaxID=2720871 RepID=A0A5N6ZQW1_9EURO|nr:uncharacterized protein BDV27DRAFT_67597 [Aspergillus caelatus]KAE8358570.1 hypothetical protein BDV27DRAFT_67597 [Aspergillus caelatus]KAE8410167.1 hypothetical protein BDV36DRAFT_145501 [Aspergillus pseudocaelatus]
MGIGSKSVKTFVAKVPWSKVIEKAGGAKDRGDRLWPSRNSKNDSTLNFRLDKGSTDSKTGNIEIILQANKNAEDPEVKKAAQKDSDAILGKVLVDPKKPNAEEARSALIASFKERN